MCGICGVIDFTGHADLNEARLQAMADTMTHRGPDDAGVYLSPDRRAGFGFRRLSIVDLAGGRQPMCNEDGTVWVAFNGEIYNHEELRKGLEERGHRYRTRSDTESIVHLYEERGPDCLHDLNGMFAIAVWDEKRGQLLLARDRLGIKPLYYAFAGNRLLFASEIKAILSQPGVQRGVNRNALALYLSFGVVPAPDTLFAGIHKLPAGHLMVVQADGSHRIEQWWDAVFPQDRQGGRSEEEYVEELRQRFRTSIQRRMMSDVPFGVFLSGGVDSSLNVALMSQMMDRPVDTFSVAIQDDARSNELSEARQVARHFGADHHEVTIATQDFVDLLPAMAYHQDEPLADPVCVPLYHVAKLARKNGTIVVQVGEGSDELFCGYESYAQQLALAPYYNLFSAMPRLVKRPAARLGSRLLSQGKALYMERAARGSPIFWTGISGLPAAAIERLLDGRGPGQSLLQELRVQEPESWLQSQYRKRRQVAGKGALLDEMIYLELKHRLPELLLMRVDKMTMANSVEARVPFLDHELVRFALSIPSALKRRSGQTKYILKKAARGLVPDWVIDRPKAGFCGSASNMVRGPLVEAAESLVRQCDDLRDIGDWAPLLELCQRNRHGEAGAGYHIWMLLNLAVWHAVWIQQAPQEQVAAYMQPRPAMAAG